MIKFFRNIRRNLLLENRTSKYLLYALGEIILVVIGILIALAINNQQEQRILQQKEQTYLNGLLDEFQTSKLKLTELIKVNQQNYLGAKKILEYVSKPETLENEQVLSKLFFRSFSNDIAFNPNNSLLMEMINSGSLKDISNNELRRRLTTWLATLDDISSQEKGLDIERTQVLNLFRTNENSIRTILDHSNPNSELNLPPRQNPMSNLDILHSVAFENNLLMFYLTSYGTEKSHYIRS
ncbi:MAG: DUF6090 family protein, partial [Bacteroidota bacterium]